MKYSKLLISTMLMGSLALAACESTGMGAGTGTGVAENPGDGRLRICPADQMQDLVGQKATEASIALGKVPAAERTPTYFIGTDQALPNDVERGATLVKLDTPKVVGTPDLGAYTVTGVYCFTGTEWVK